MACRNSLRQAMSLWELTVVIAVIGLLTVATASQYGYSSLGNSGAHGVVRKLALALVHARRSTIATGDNHYLQLTSSGGKVVSYALFRRASGGDIQVDETRLVPGDVTVTTTQSTLEFDFEGSALAAYNITVAGADRSWQLVVTPLTGSVQVTETTL